MVVYCKNGDHVFKDCHTPSDVSHVQAIASPVLTGDYYIPLLITFKLIELAIKFYQKF